MAEYFTIAVDTEDPLEFQDFYKKLEELPQIKEIDYILSKCNHDILIMMDSRSESALATIRDMKYCKDIAEVGEEFKREFNTVSLI